MKRLPLVRDRNELGARAEERYRRQFTVEEIGREGQQRILTTRQAPATPEVRGFARVIEIEYLQRAGITVVGGDGPPTAAPDPSEGLAHESTRAMSEGAFAALVGVRRAIGLAT